MADDNMRLLGELDQLQEKALQELDEHIGRIPLLADAFSRMPNQDMEIAARCLFFVVGVLHKRRAAIQLLEENGGSDGKSTL